MYSDEELIKKAKDLYKKLGGVGSSDPRIIRGLWERIEKKEIPEQASTKSTDQDYLIYEAQMPQKG
jgi:hypothetical protein